MSKKSIIPALVVVFSSMVSAQRSTSIATDEILVLLRAGVSPAEVEGLVARRGGPRAVTEADLEAVRAAGGTDATLAVLARRLEAHATLRRLARTHDTWSHEGAGVSLIHPRHWIVSPTIGSDSALVTIQRDAAGPRSWFRTPRIFVWVQRGTPFPRSSQPELAGKVARLISKRLESAGMEPRGFAAGLGEIAGESCPEHRLTATVPRLEFDGTLLIRTRVLLDGTVVSIGYSCSQGDEESVKKLFGDVADSIAVAPR